MMMMTVMALVLVLLVVVVVVVVVGVVAVVAAAVVAVVAVMHQACGSKSRTLVTSAKNGKLRETQVVMSKILDVGCFGKLLETDS